MSLIRCCCGASNPCGITVPSTLVSNVSTGLGLYRFALTSSPTPTPNTLVWQTTPTAIAGTVDYDGCNNGYNGGAPNFIVMPASAWYDGPYVADNLAAGTYFYLMIFLRGCKLTMATAIYGSGGATFSDYHHFDWLLSNRVTSSPLRIDAYASWGCLSSTAASQSSGLTGTSSGTDVTPDTSGNAGAPT